MASSIYDFVAFAETNLMPEIQDSELCMTDYTIFRSDRSELTSVKSGGGGVLIGVRNSIPCHRLTSSIANIECVFVSCKISSCDLILGVVYIPPNQPLSSYSDFCTAVDEVVHTNHTTDNIVLLGDFNIPGVDWTMARNTSTTRSAHIMSDLSSAYNMNQINTVTNSNGSVP